MSQSFAAEAGRGSMAADMPVMDSMFRQYEKVVITSLISAFGLDFIVRDQHGGDVDTLHNVRQIGKDSEMNYKSGANAQAYFERPVYDSRDYHSHATYKAVNKEAKALRKAGQLEDAYTGERFARNARTNLDHVVAAKEIHDDRARVLAGLNGEDLANCPENLKITNERTNKSKKADSMDDFLKRRGDEYTEEERERMREVDRSARADYDHKLFVAYYGSSSFLKHSAAAAGKVGIQMGLRQALGLVFAEIWFAVKEEFQKLQDAFKLDELFLSLAEGVKRGIEKARSRYREILALFKEGMIAGALASISTTLCNIFFTTAKSAVRIIRQSWASLVEAIKILLFNPDSLPLGERLGAAVKVLAVGASIVAGNLVSGCIASSALAALPVVGDIVPAFCGTLVSGILSCTLLYMLDRGEMVQKIMGKLNNIPTMSAVDSFYRQEARRLEEFAAQVAAIDLETFRKESAACASVAARLDAVRSEAELSDLLQAVYAEQHLPLPWQGDFCSFMGGRDNQLVFA